MIVHATRDFPPRINGGLSRAVGSIVSGLADAGVNSRVISVDAWRRNSKGTSTLPTASDTDTARRVGAKDDPSDAVAWALAAQPTVVHVHAPLLWPLAETIAREAGGVARVHTLHVVAAEQDRLRGLSQETRTAAAQRQAIAEADRLLAPSTQTAATVADLFPSARDKLRVAPIGVPDSPAAARAFAARADRSGQGRVLFLGRFSDMAGVDGLAALIGELATRSPDSTLVVAGGLPDNPRAEGKWRETIASAGAAAGLATEFTGWLRTADAVFETCADADVLVAPNRFATFGLAAAEAMLTGLVVCAYAVGGLGDLIVDGQSGRLVKSVPAALADAAAAMLDSPGQALTIGRAGRDRVLREFNQERSTQTLRSIYGEVA